MVEAVLPARPPTLDALHKAPTRGHRLDSSPHLLAVLEHAVATRVAAGTAASAVEPTAVTTFHAVRAPGVSPADYLNRLVRNAHCSRSAFVVALVYLDRAAAKRPELALTPLNVHRLLLAATLLATKYLDDVLYDNAHFAYVGGLDVPELNLLELDLLHVLDFRTHVDLAAYADAEAALVQAVVDDDKPESATLRFALTNVEEYKAPAPASPKSIIPGA